MGNTRRCLTSTSVATVPGVSGRVRAPWHFFLKWEKPRIRFQLNEAAGRSSDVMSKQAESWRDQFCSQIRAGILIRARAGVKSEAVSGDQRLTLNLITHYKAVMAWAPAAVPGRANHGGTTWPRSAGASAGGERSQDPVGAEGARRITKADLDAARVARRLVPRSKGASRRQSHPAAARHLLGDR